MRSQWSGFAQRANGRQGKRERERGRNTAASHSRNLSSGWGHHYKKIITVDRVSLRLDHRATRHRLENPPRCLFFRFLPLVRRRPAARTCEFSATRGHARKTIGRLVPQFKSWIVDHACRAWETCRGI